MSDQLGLFGREEDTGNVDVDALRKALAAGAADTPTAPPPRPTTRRAAMRAQREARQRRRRRKRRHSYIAIGILLLLIGGMVGGWFLWKSDEPVVPDFAGPPGLQTVVWIKQGDGRSDIAATLAAQGVVASTEAFLNTTENDAQVQALQPGYIRVQTQLSAASAADQLVDEVNRVGHVELRPGDRLADVTTAVEGGEPVAGYISKIVEASCVSLDGAVPDCATTDEVWSVLSTVDPTDLVPSWALEGVLASPEPLKRFEGMLVPGEYDVPPNAPADELVSRVMKSSLNSWNGSTIVNDAKAAGLTPYEMVTIASIIERESNTDDMSKVARVIDNRRQIQMPLQMDSTVNYAAGLAAVSTTADLRASGSPWNTYWTEANPTAAKGLPPTPISSPGPNALAATTKPASGPWMYFVLLDPTTNESCFSATFEEHEACIEVARANGVFDG